MFARHGAAVRAEQGVYTGYLFTSMSTNALILEPVFYWPEARHAIIENTIEPQHLARLPKLDCEPRSATAVVVEARRAAERDFHCASVAPISRSAAPMPYLAEHGIRGVAGACLRC